MTLSRLLQQLDGAPAHVRGRQFERLVKWLLENAPEYRQQFKAVWLWDDWPGRDGPDRGIDIVAEDHDGRLWAVQAKAVDPSRSITKREIDSFLAEAAPGKFAYRLLVATTDNLSPGAVAAMDRYGDTGRRMRTQLDSVVVEWPESFEELLPARRAPQEPQPHQREALDAIVAGLTAQPRGQIQMAPGTGKTLVGLRAMEELGANTTLVCVPSLSLLGQTLASWTANATSPFQYLAVCSDESVTSADELVAHTTDLGVPVTTSPDTIRRFLAAPGRRVVFSTYQSTPQVSAAMQAAPPLDLLVADEAHRTAGVSDSPFAVVLDDARIPAAKRLFMTATPRYLTSRVSREAQEFGFQTVSMDDHAVYGPVLHHLTFGQAIERKLLADYQVVVIATSDEASRAQAEAGTYLKVGERSTDARTLAAQIGLAKAVRAYNLRRIITFHSRVAAARRFATDFPAVVEWMPEPRRPLGTLWTAHVSGGMSTGRRDALLRRFSTGVSSDERTLLSNARCLVEGIDVPGIDGVAFIDPRESPIDVVQAVGRAIRKAHEGKIGTIVLPVFIPDGETAEKILDSSAFKAVWAVLRALRAHDEALGEELDELRRSMGRLHGRPQRPGKVHLLLPESVHESFAESFDVRLVESATYPFQYGLGVLQAYVAREGHARVPQQHLEDGFRLGQWVSERRTERKRGQLPADRAASLEALPDWTWTPQPTRSHGCSRF